MERIKFAHGIAFEHTGEGEYTLRLKTPQIKMLSEQTSNHLKLAKREALLALRSILDNAINVEEKGG